MKPPYIHINEVYHVGALEVSERARQDKGSLEAFCLSVTRHPEDWTSIAKLGGNPVWEMSRSGSLWLDVLALDDASRDEIAVWAKDCGFAEPATYWRSWSTDEDGEWRYIRCASFEAAEFELDDPDRDGPCANGSCIEVENGYRLTELGMQQLERWQEATDYMDGLIILYARDVLAPGETRLAGLWWDEVHDPEMLSCPRGAILPARLSQFQSIKVERTPSDTYEP